MNTPTKTAPAKATPLQQFQASLKTDDVAAALADGLIGKDAVVDGPYGIKPLVYADYVASGRALMQVERFVLEQVLPYYANSHTEASYCGGFITRLRREARAAIARCCGAGDKHAVIFAGFGRDGGDQPAGAPVRRARGHCRGPQGPRDHRAL
jgi:selenocysteine lyase/cysteine desulfurase